MTEYEGPLKGKTILVVDDEPDILELLEEELDVCSVDAVKTFEEAKDRLNERRYDLVVLDVMGVNGYELLNISVLRGIPAVILTANALTPTDLLKSMQMGARCYIPKEKMGELLPLLEEIVTTEESNLVKLLFDRLGEQFNKLFGPDWKDEHKDGLDKLGK